MRQRLGYSSFTCKSSWILITSRDLYCMKKHLLVAGAGEPGGSGGVGPPLELEIYLVNFLKIRKKNFFLVSDPP